MFPERTASKLKLLDRSDTGLITKKKLEKAMIALAKEKTQTRRAFRGFLTVLTLALILLLSTCGITFFVVQISKELVLDRDHVLLTAHGGQQVHLASADFSLM